MSKPFTPKDGFRELAPGEVLAGLHHVDFDNASTIVRRANAYAGDYFGDGRDLLHDAVTRAVVSRSCREGIPIEAFLAGVMRSLASTARRSRERREEQRAMPIDWLAGRSIDGALVTQSADELIEIERIRQICAEVIDLLSAESDQQAALIDGIGLDFRGRALADYVGISPEELATARRKLKRHAERLWPHFERRLPSSTDDG